MSLQYLLTSHYQGVSFKEQATDKMLDPSFISGKKDENLMIEAA